MTNEQINRLVAEELGWKPFNQFNRWLKRPNDSSTCELPDFCNDHNAAAEMRKGIAVHERRGFTTNLIAVVMGPGRVMGMVDSVWPMLHSTPRQQAEAFLRLRGKWREE